MTQTETTTQPRPKFTNPPTDDSLLLPDEVSDVPPAVKAANDGAMLAYGRCQSAKAEFFAAKQRLKDSPHLDRQADSAAMSSGQPLPTRRAEPAAREAFSAADRLYRAARDSFNEAQRDLAAAIVADREQWLSEQGETVNEARRKVRELLDQLAAAMDTLDAERRLARGLRTFPPQGALTTVRMGRPSSLQGTPAQQRAKAVESLRKTTHIGGTFAGHVQRNTEHLLAALLLLAEG